MPRRDPTLPEEHIGQIEPGFKRDEEVAKRKDSLDAEIERMAAEEGGLEAIDEEKFHHIDNEIAHRIGRDGQIEITGRRPDYDYCFVAHAGEFQGAARSNVRTAHAKMQGAGWTYVSDLTNDPESKELRGNDCASGTTNRGWGDTVLMKIRKVDHVKQDEYIANKLARTYAVEEQTVALGHAKGVTIDVFAGDIPQNNVRLRQVFGRMGGPEIIRVTPNVSDDMIRRGAIPGAPAAVLARR